MDILSKPKEKRSGPVLLWVTEYMFVLPCSIDDCIKQLNILKAKYRQEITFFKGRHLNFETLNDNGRVVHVEIKATATRQVIEVKSIGQLIYKDYNHTLVKLQIGVTRKSVIEDLIISIALGALFTLSYRSISGLVAIIGLTIIILFTTLISFVYMKSELYASIYEVLQEVRTSHPQTLPP